MSRKNLRNQRIATGLVLTVLIWVTTGVGFAQVEGRHGQAPVLPPNVPGIERPFPQDNEKFRFVIIGDKTGGGERNWPIFDRAMDETSRLRPDFAIMVGDLIQGGTTDMKVVAAEWKEFLEHASRIKVPFFFLPGNHDISNKAMYDYWQTNVGRTYYSFDYKGCHFILLNTEEGWRNNEVTFGSEQLAWIRKDIEAHRDAKRIFVFMHRPVWYYSDEPYKQWEQIESWLAGLPFTVFAGHFHRLAYERRNDRPYYVLSATGGALTPKETLPYGSFHHYTTVTVDGNDVHIAIIEPGSVHPHDIALREFREKTQQILTWERQLPLRQGVNNGKVIAHLNNQLDRTAAVRLRVQTSPEHLWKVTPTEITLVLQPRETTEVPFRVNYSFANLLAGPTCDYDISIADDRLVTGSIGFFSEDEVEMKPVEDWLVADPVDLGVSEKITDSDKERLIPAFAEKTDLGDSQPVNWKAANAYDCGWLDLKLIYREDFALGYGRTHVHSPSAQMVLASIAGDDFMKVLANQKEVLPYVGYMGAGGKHTYFLLPLEVGWNTLLVKCASYTAQWGYLMRIADPNGELIVSADRTKNDESVANDELRIEDDKVAPPPVSQTEPAIRITNAPPFAESGPNTWGFIAGEIQGVDPRQHRVVVFAYDDRWYIQPFSFCPHTRIDTDGTWQTGTHLGFRYAALLVKPSYAPPNTPRSLPDVGGEILAIIEIKPKE
jgi:hypothetical protein